MSVFASCLREPLACLVPMEVEDGVGSPGAGGTDGWEPPCECWEPNPGPLGEQLVLLTTGPSSPAPFSKIFNDPLKVMESLQYLALGTFNY